jgi:hypothetical protein
MTAIVPIGRAGLSKGAWARKNRQPRFATRFSRATKSPIKSIKEAQEPWRWEKRTAESSRSGIRAANQVLRLLPTRYRSHGLEQSDPITRLTWTDDICGCQAKAKRGLHMP